MSCPPIPLFRPQVAAEAAPRIARVLASGRLGDGPVVREFEHEFARWLGAVRVHALSDHAAGLQLALRLAGVGPGDEVAISPLACSASVMPIAAVGARPLWCDVSPRTAMLDVDDLQARVTPRTRAVILCHWSGNPGDTAGLARVAGATQLRLIEDVSEALGAEHAGVHAGAAPVDFAVFSFYAVKPLTTGEGGALVCARVDDHERAARLRRYGLAADFRRADGELDPDSDVPDAGYNFCMTSIAAAMGLAQMPALDGLIARARENGQRYDAALARVPGITRFERSADARPSYWTYSLLAERRDDLARKLRSLGIGCQRLHVRQDAYRCFGGRRAELPGVAAVDAANLSLPCGAWVQAPDLERIVAAVESGW